jgi:hypothetical protein
MKMLNILMILSLLISPTARAEELDGGRDSGGGDLCEDRIKIIRDDIKSWIKKGGPNKGLILPAGWDVATYSNAMLAAIEDTHIQCVKEGDPDFPVMYNQTPKVCVWERVNNGNKSFLVTCDYKSFLDKKTMDESEQYRLIHHEYAGPANIEIPNADDSDYRVSNQISGYLETKVIKQLAVREPKFISKIKTEFFPKGTRLALKRDLRIAPKSKTIRAESGGWVNDVCWFTLKNQSDAERIFRAGKVLTVTAVSNVNVKWPSRGSVTEVLVDNPNFSDITCTTIFSYRNFPEYYPKSAGEIEELLLDIVDVQPATPEEIQ